MAAVKAPTRLGTASRKLWRDVTGEYELGFHELRILEDACREMDLIDRLEAALTDAKLVVKGSMGQEVSSPLVQEIRQHRAVLMRLFVGLKLPEDESSSGRSSAAARSLADARWRGRGA